MTNDWFKSHSDDDDDDDDDSDDDDDVMFQWLNGLNRLNGPMALTGLNGSWFSDSMKMTSLLSHESYKFSRYHDIIKTSRIGPDPVT